MARLTLKKPPPKAPQSSAAAPPTLEQKSKLENAEEQPAPPNQRPTSGRTTPQGRKVEKPGSGSPAGPSGQPGKTLHDRRHANK
ncbi:MAG: hypothetical protein H0X13_09460 [Ramlibacter sp.]|nr:hypothetical protein [Ramlibacter sp.]